MNERERNKSHVERFYELAAELAGVPRDEIAANLAENERVLSARGGRKLAENGTAARATAVGAVEKFAPNVSVSDAEAALRAIWDFSSNPTTLGELKNK